MVAIVHRARLGGGACECSYAPPKLTVDAGGPYEGQPGQVIRFHATASSPVAPIGSYAWQFGDGTTAMGADVTHVYASQFWGQANLLVTDEAQDAGGAVAVVQICGGAGARCDESPDQCCAGTTCNATTLACE